MHDREQPGLRPDGSEQPGLRPDGSEQSRLCPDGSEQPRLHQEKGILGQRRRRLAWIGFLLLAAYAPVVAWLTPDDSWLMPVAVAGVVGYVIIVDDVLRRRPDTPTRDRPVDGPGSGSSEASEREISSD